MKVVTALIANTKGEGKAGDDFWVKAETLLYTALIGYIHYEAPVEEQNFSTLIEFINAMEVREDDEEFQNPVLKSFQKFWRYAYMAFFNSAINILSTLVVALGGGVCAWGGINLLEGYGNDNPGANTHVP